LAAIESELSGFYEKDQLNDLNLYLYGVILKERGYKDAAKEAFIKSLSKFPLIWSVWLELSSLMTKNDKPLFQRLPEHWTKFFFYASFYLEIHQETDCINTVNQLLKYFPKSVFLFNLIAQASYNNQEFDTSLDWFEKLTTIDPFRSENMDLYSNILYIKENYGELAFLAHRTFHNDKYRPETCCVIGNYYSLRGDHAKAVIYFKRAIKLDPKFLSAWTLMGHEYLEMKNTQSAIESYRTAVDIDPSDYRAWYGLGQTYEIHQMYNYAAYYYANAALARPQDSRMWCAVAGCYDKMDKKAEAAKCYERGEKSKDKEGIVLHRLAKLYLSMNEVDKAAKCFEENLKRKDQEAVQSAESVEAIMFLAKYYKSKEEYEESVKYATRLHDYSGPEREEASALIREIRKSQKY
jgi:anaphase-promoting complex subunit 8